MIFKKIYLFAILGLCIYLAGCRQNPINFEGREYYPNKDGYSWMYIETVDGEDTTYIWTFKGNKYFDGKNVQIRFFEYPAYPILNSNQLLLITESEVINYGDESYPDSDDPSFVLKFPLKVGNTWKLDSSARASIISNNETVTVPAGTFTNCYKITISAGNARYDRYYAKNVGMIKEVYQTAGYSSVTELKSKNF